MKCALAKDVNECPYYNKEDEECSNEGNCSFKASGEGQVREKYIRKERWYEKYYRK